MSEKIYRTDQETFWAGSFGDQYIARNDDAHLLASNLAFFSQALSRAAKIESCLEIGANIGMNLRALQSLYPGQTQFAVEINNTAANKLRKLLPEDRVFESSVLDIDLERAVGTGGCDLVLTKGVLIHVQPAHLCDVYAKLVAATKRYLLVCEYYNPTPVTVEYRGHAERLYKRDFAGEIMDRFPVMELLDYGFCYRRDRAFPQDDITWFLMTRRLTADAA